MELLMRMRSTGSITSFFNNYGASQTTKLGGILMATQRHIGVHMSDEEYEQCDYADEAAFRSPIPTQVVSNGEYNPMPQTEDQRKVEGLIKEMGGERSNASYGYISKEKTQV